MPLPTFFEDDETEGFAADFSRLTLDVTLQSHTHGRERRAERGISRAELQAAVKYGRKERATPSRRGEPRWKFTHAGVVYITDESMKHEITSWRLEDNHAVGGGGPGVLGGAAAGGFTVHVVFLVDHSGSMRKDDVSGFTSRTNAVYNCLRQEFLQPQLELSRRSGSNKRSIGDAVVSIIQMSTESSLVLGRAPVDERLCNVLDSLSGETARNHGHYLPALDALDELLTDDIDRPVQMIVFFLSDGEPSDHLNYECRHGVSVWEAEYAGRGRISVLPNGRPRLQSCGPSVRDCRAEIKQLVRDACCQKLRDMGDKFGRDRLSFHTVAFGPAQEDFQVLQDLSQVLPRSTFQKLGLSANLLTSAFTSLTSTLTTMRTAAGGSGRTGMTLRQTGPRESVESFQERPRHIFEIEGWDVYVGRNLISKKAFDSGLNFVTERLEPGATGVAVFHCHFAQGSERYAYRCFEVGPDPATSRPGKPSKNLVTVGLPLVAKETIHEEEMIDANFHKRMAQVQTEAENLAMRFNERVRRLRKFSSTASSLEIHFVPCSIYEVRDDNYRGGKAWILAEPQLEGKFTKWNNNAGSLLNSNSNKYSSSSSSAVDDVPQAFSHFSWSVTDGKKLLCDLQGVWNATDGFQFTDPAMHHSDRDSRGKSKKHSTDKGPEGIQAFFESHVCSDLCRSLGLKKYRNQQQVYVF